MKKDSPKFRRILLKLSGEILLGEQNFGIDEKITDRIAKEIEEIVNLGVEVAIVVGGGNIFRGIDAKDMNIKTATADYMGMLATVINGMALQDILESNNMVTRLMTAIEMKAVAEPFIRRRAIHHLEKGRVIIFSAGTGNPHFTTDTAAALRAMEIEAEVVLKATKVKGVYDKDPEKDKKAAMFDKIKYFDVLEKNLKIIDSTAISLCMDNSLPIIIFSIREEGNLKKIIMGEKIGTIIS